MNQVILVGRLVYEPELKQSQSGTTYLNTRIAVSRNDKDKTTDFINVHIYSKTAEFVSKYFRKGSMCIVSGRLQMRRYEAKDGTNRTAYEIVADSVYFGESKKD